MDSGTDSAAGGTDAARVWAFGWEGGRRAWMGDQGPSPGAGASTSIDLCGKGVRADADQGPDRSRARPHGSTETLVVRPASDPSALR